MTQPPATERTLRQRILFVLRPVLAVAAVLLFVMPFALGLIFSAALTNAPCAGGESPAIYNLPYEEITFLSSEFQQSINGYFIPGDNGVTILIPPAYSSGRDNQMHEVAALHPYGYSFLTFESRRCMGHRLSLGYAEVREVGDALDYLATRADVDMERLGIHGYSAGGATAIMAGARYPQLKAVSAEGGYHDFAEQLSDNVETQWPGLGLLYELGVHIGYRLTTGYDLSVLSPVSVIGQIAPRPILLIYGSVEPSLPGARLQLAAAGENAQLWEVPGAWHGSYLHTAPEAFVRRMVTFYDNAFAIRR